MARLLALALVVTPLLAACGPARQSSASGGPTVVYVSPSDVTTKIVGATPQQGEILRASLSGIGNDRIETVTVEEPESGWGSSPDDVALRFSPRTQAAHDMRTAWEAWLVADAFAVRSRELRLPSVAYMTYPGETSAIGEVAYEMARRGTKAKVDAFVRLLEVESKRADAQVQEIKVLKPLDFALAITLQVGDPAEFLERRAPKFFERLGDPPGDFDLRFVDSQGNRISENWHALSTGSVWVRQDLDGCSPYLVSRSTLYKPPPCPTDAAEFHVETVAASDVTTKIVGGTPKQQAVLRKILAGIGPTRLDSVEVVTEVEKGWGATPNAIGIESKAAQPDGYSYWQAQLVGDAFGGLSLELGLPPVAYIGDGESQDGGLDFSTDPSKTPLTRAEAEEALRRVAEIAKRYGASTRARVLKPRRLAFAVDFRTERPAEFLRNGLERALTPIEADAEGRKEGLYVKVVDAKGRRVLENGAGYWVRPDLVQCSPYAYFGSTMEPPPPPCPVEGNGRTDPESDLRETG